MQDRPLLLPQFITFIKENNSTCNKPSQIKFIPIHKKIPKHYGSKLRAACAGAVPTSVNCAFSVISACVVLVILFSELHGQ